MSFLLRLKRCVWFKNGRPTPWSQLLWLGVGGSAYFILWLLNRLDIPGPYQDGIKRAGPILVGFGVFGSFIAASEFVLNRPRISPMETSESKGQLLLTDEVREMCSTYDAWKFGKNAIGADARYTEFASLVSNAKVVVDTNTTGMMAHLDDDRSTLVLRLNANLVYNLHELVHVYQQVCWRAMSLESEGRIGILTYIRAELEATWFAGQTSWFLGWLLLPPVVFLAFIIYIICWATGPIGAL